MTSKITKEQFRANLLEFIEENSFEKIDELKKMLEDEANTTGDYPSSPGKPSLKSIKSTGEKAFQRAIFNNKYSLLDFKRNNGYEKVDWLDLELPVTLNKNPRRRSIDLIGSIDGVPVLCELKYKEKSHSDNPIYAMVELLIYRYFISCNYEKLDKYDVHHHLIFDDFKWGWIAKNPFPQLLVVANRSYWDYWFNRIPKNDLWELVKKISLVLDSSIHFFETEDEDYIKQKGLDEKYKPSVNSNVWKKIKLSKL